MVSDVNYRDIADRSADYRLEMPVVAGALRRRDDYYAFLTGYSTGFYAVPFYTAVAVVFCHPGSYFVQFYLFVMIIGQKRSPDFSGT